MPIYARDAGIPGSHGTRRRNQGYAPSASLPIGIGHGKRNEREWFMVSGEVKERGFAEKAATVLNIGLEMGFRIAVVIFVLAITLPSFAGTAERYSETIGTWLPPATVLLLLVYFAHKYVMRIDDAHQRLGVVEGKIRTYENLGIIQELYKKEYKKGVK